MFVSPNSRLTVSMGTPLDRSMVVAAGVSCNVIGNTSLDTALLGYIFEFLIARTIARNFEDVVIPAHTLIFLDDAFWDIEQSNIGFCVGLLSSRDNPQIAIEECLQVVIGEVLDIRICQSRKHREDKEVSHKFVCLALHRSIHHPLYLITSEVASINAFGAVDISCKGVEWQLSRITGYGNDMFKHYHIAPNCIGATTLLGAEEILEVVDKCEIQLLQRNIRSAIGMLQKLPDVITYGTITGVCTFVLLCPTFFANSTLCCSKSFTSVSCLTPIPR